MTTLIIILCILALPFMIALFSPREYTIEREIIINKSQTDVFNYLKLLKNQDYYSKWVMTDPNMKKTFTGTDGTVGFIYAWDSKNKQAGAGEQEIKKLTGEERIDMEVRFARPFKGVAHTHFIIENADDNQTKVKWVFQNSMKYPMNMMGLFMNFDKILGGDILVSLNNLKAILEENSGK